MSADLIPFDYEGRPVRAEDLPESAEYGGHVYVLAFDNDTIKVGASSNPRARFAAHRAQARSFGANMVAGWLSPLHEDHLGTERSLIGIAGRLGGTALGREYFRGAAFDRIVKRAEKLPFPPVDIEAHKARSDATLKFLQRVVLGPAKGSPPSYLDHIHETIARLFGKVPGGAYQLSARGVDEAPADLVEKMAAVTGRDVDDLRQMDFIDYLEYLITSAVYTEALWLRAYALENDREDLLAPMFPGPPTRPTLALVPEDPSPEQFGTPGGAA